MKNVFKTILFFSALILSIFSVTSCSSDDDDDQTVDIREQAEGVYNYSIELDVIDADGELQPIDGEETGTFTVKRNANDSKMIDFIENGNVFLNGSKVAEASNGFTFDG